VLRLAAADAIWANAFGAGDLVELDAGTGEELARIPVGDEPEGLDVGFGSVWVVLQSSGQLARVDPTSETVLQTWPLGNEPRLVTTGTQAVYASVYYDGTVVRVDPATGTSVTSERLCGGPHEMLELGDSVYVACTTTDEVVRIDPTTLAERGRVDVEAADALAVAPGGQLLVGTEDGPSVAVLDPAAMSVTRTVVAGSGHRVTSANVDLVASDDGAWISDPNLNLVLHVAWSDLIR
jgi:streptogramin lyase